MEEKLLTLNNLADLPSVAKTILKDFRDERVFAIQGKMGAGKTTLIKALCEELGVVEMVSSPTFALVNEYTDANKNGIFHFDFYRIKKVEEVYDIGYEEYLYGGNYCFMEWPELILDLLPESHIFLTIEVDSDERRIIKYNVRSI